MMQACSEISQMTLEERSKVEEKLARRINKSLRREEKFETSQTIHRRENKNRPKEMSSKIPNAPRPRYSNIQPKKIIRDPRFESLCGEFDPKAFEKSYSFLKKMQSKEYNQLKRSMNDKNLDPEEKKIIRTELARMENRHRELSRKNRKEKQAEKERKLKIDDLKSGKAPEYKRKSETKLMELVTQYNELKEKGKLAKHIVKKRKKILSKERKKYDI